MLHRRRCRLFEWLAHKKIADSHYVHMHLHHARDASDAKVLFEELPPQKERTVGCKNIKLLGLNCLMMFEYILKNFVNFYKTLNKSCNFYMQSSNYFTQKVATHDPKCIKIFSFLYKSCNSQSKLQKV